MLDGGNFGLGFFDAQRRDEGRGVIDVGEGAKLFGDGMVRKRADLFACPERLAQFGFELFHGQDTVETGELRSVCAFVAVRQEEGAAGLAGADGFGEEDDGSIEVFPEGFAACAVLAKWNVLSRQQAGE